MKKNQLKIIPYGLTSDHKMWAAIKKLTKQVQYVHY